MNIDEAVWVALRLLLAVTAVGIAPGALLLVAMRSRENKTTEIELLGFGAALSFVLVQLVTIGAITWHWSAGVSLGLLAAISVGALVAVWHRRGTVLVEPHRLLLLAIFSGVGALLYVQGAPYSSSEDQIHVALVRRLAFWSVPDSSHLYFLAGAEPGFYPYPFPAIHYLMSLVTRLSDIDAFFVYHKLRAFWGPVALSLLYLGAAAVFGARAAYVSTLTAVAFVLGGTFATGYNYFWGQLAPFSHASDVALGVLLPALIVSTCRYASSEDKRDMWVFGALTIGLTGALCIVHPREVIQQLVYLAALVAAALAPGGDRTARLRRAAGLLAASLAVALVYKWWNAAEVSFASAVVDQQRQTMLDRMRSASWFDLLIGVPSKDTQGAQLLFLGWNPIVLFFSPLLLLAYRNRMLVRFVGISILAYLLVFRFPIFTIPYTLASYFEITTSPMRNFIFFIHMGTGVLVWMAAGALSRLPVARAIAAWLAIVAVVAGLWRIGPGWLFDHQDWFFLPVIAAWIAVLAWTWRAAPAGDEPQVTASRVAYWASLMAAFVAWTWTPGTVMASNAEPAGSPLTARYEASLKLPTDVVRILGSCVEYPDQPLPFQPADGDPVRSGPFRICPPTPAFLAWAHRNLPVDAVVAASKSNPYPLSAYLPVRMLAWPSMTLTYHNETLALPAYYRLWDRALRTHRAQPFFNTAESREEREEFLQTLAVDYVVIDPNYHESLTPVLDQYPDLLTPQYNEEQWTVYQVKRAR